MVQLHPTITFEHLVICFARRISRNKDKFQDRIIKCLFLGYPMGQKGWLVFDFDKEKTFVSRDVIFHGHIPVHQL